MVWHGRRRAPGTTSAHPQMPAVKQTAGGHRLKSDTQITLA